MALPIAQNTTYIGRSSPIREVCRTRTDLLDRLAGLVANLGCAKLQLTNSIETEDAVQLECARLEIERLRNACSSLKAELENHRAQHGC